MWRRRAGTAEVLLAHFGGPIWAKRDAGAWAIPKGLVEAGEELEACARREFEEELGVRPEGALTPLGRVRQKGDNRSRPSRSNATPTPPRSLATLHETMG